MNAEIDISNVVLFTERLTLRPWRQTDLEDFFEYASVDGVGQMAGWLPHQSREESHEILEKFIEGKKTFAIDYQGKAIGSLGIEKYNDELFTELEPYRGRSLGFVLSKDYWGQGLMPEAVRRVIRWLFEDIGLDFIMCGYFNWNSRSRRVQEKCGFEQYRQTLLQTTSGITEFTMENILWKKDWLANEK